MIRSTGDRIFVVSVLHHNHLPPLQDSLYESSIRARVIVTSSGTRHATVGLQLVGFGGYEPRITGSRVNRCIPSAMLLTDPWHMQGHSSDGTPSRFDRLIVTKFAGINSRGLVRSSQLPTCQGAIDSPPCDRAITT